MIAAPSSLEKKLLAYDKKQARASYKSLMTQVQDKIENIHAVNTSYYKELTELLLDELIATSLKRLGEDPLSRFNTPLALLDGHTPRAYYNHNINTIVISKSLIESLEFIIANAAFTNLNKKIKQQLLKNGKDPHNLVNIITNSQTAVYSLVQSRLMLHTLAEEPLPAFASLLPPVYRTFIKEQIELCLVFILLHEQAHLEFRKNKSKKFPDLDLENKLLKELITNAKKEELAADHWAIKQLKKENRVTLIKAGVFFFFNHWSIDYMAYRMQGNHPAGFNRIQALVQIFPEFKEKDPAFFEIIGRDLSRQEKFIETLTKKATEERFFSMLSFCRSLGKYELFEELVKALSKTYDELHLY
ncbi:hypothetical protein ACJD0Z_03355 [Flavobacteriaceae bacterium M23B6Z8]